MHPGCDLTAFYMSRYMQRDKARSGRAPCSPRRGRTRTHMHARDNDIQTVLTGGNYEDLCRAGKMHEATDARVILLRSAINIAAPA